MAGIPDSGTAKETLGRREQFVRGAHASKNAKHGAADAGVVRGWASSSFPEEERFENKATGKGATSSRTALGWLRDSALAAEGQRCETYTIDVASRNLLRNLLDLSTQKVLHRGNVRQTFLEDTVWVSPAATIQPACLCADARPCASAVYSGGGRYPGARCSVNKRWLFARGWDRDQPPRNLAEGIHRSSHSRCAGLCGASAVYPSESGDGKLVAKAAEYRYCSAFPGFRLDAWPPAAEAAIGVVA